MSPLIKTLVALSLSSHFSAQAIDLRIDNVRIYQSDSRTFSVPSSLYIEQGKIVNIKKAEKLQTPADSVVNANNQFAVPGLIDLHVHLGSSGSNYSDFQYLPVQSHFNSNLYLGVTSIVDLFSFKQTLDEAAKLKKQSQTPNLFYAGTLFTNLGGHGSQFGGSAYEIANDDDIDIFWEKHLSTSPSVTKAVIESFGGMGSSLTDSQLAELGKRSKAENLPYFVHVSTLKDGKRAIKAGATALAHGINSEAIDEEFISLMKKNQVTYIPTLAVYHNHPEEKYNTLISSQEELLATVPSKLKSCLFEKVPAPSKWTDNAWQARKHAYENISRLQQAGITIGTGSDAGNPYTLHGTGLHNEIDALKKAGLSNTEILNAATINGAKAINQSTTLGQLNKGYEASFFLLSNNPIENIEHIHDISQVYKSGIKIEREQLIAQNQAITPVGPNCHEETVSITASNVIDDFQGDSPWQELSDTIMGGKSSVKIDVGHESITIKTAITKPTSFGAWAGSEIKFPQVVDASKYQGIRLSYKGSNVPFGLSIYHKDVKDWDHFSTVLTPSKTWKTVELPFSQFKQFGFGNSIKWSAKQLTGINLMWRKMPGANNAVLSNELEVKELAYF
ncbi:CIA30 family protein [Colwelliaceae bacterium 6441]